MDIREIGQTVVGVLILNPDQVLFNTALNNSILFAGLVHSAQLNTGTIDIISLLQALLIILGLGLLMGISITAATAIAFFVAIGAGAGLFEAGQLLNVFGGRLSFGSQAFSGATSLLVAYPILSDLFLFAPFAILAAGIFAWHHRRKADKLKTMKEVDSHLRQYCTSCGVHVGPGQKKCKSCGTAFTKEELDAHCTGCGRRIPSKANFCTYCGAEILLGNDRTCPSCTAPVAQSARHCPKCGSRLPSEQKKNDPAYVVR